MCDCMTIVPYYECFSLQLTAYDGYVDCNPLETHQMVTVQRDVSQLLFVGNSSVSSGVAGLRDGALTCRPSIPPLLPHRSVRLGISFFLRNRFPCCCFRRRISRLWSEACWHKPVCPFLCLRMLCLMVTTTWISLATHSR